MGDPVPGRSFELSGNGGATFGLLVEPPLSACLSLRHVPKAA